MSDSIYKIHVYRWSAEHIGLKYVQIDENGDNRSLKEYYAFLPNGGAQSSKPRARQVFGRLYQIADSKTVYEYRIERSYARDRLIFLTKQQLTDMLVIKEILMYIEKNDLEEKKYHLESLEDALPMIENSKMKDFACDFVYGKISCDEAKRRCEEFIIKLRTKGIKFTKRECQPVKQPIEKYVLYQGGNVCKSNNINQWFGLKVQEVSEASEASEDFCCEKNSIHHGKEIYYKKFSRYHNCAGYVRYLLEYAGVKAFCDTSSLETLGATNPANFEKFMKKATERIQDLNKKANFLFNEYTFERIKLYASYGEYDDNSVIQEVKALKLDSYFSRYRETKDITLKIKNLILIIEKLYSKKGFVSSRLSKNIIEKIIMTYTDSSPFNNANISNDSSSSDTSMGSTHISVGYAF